MVNERRAKALKIAKNTHKAIGVFRLPNRGKKKCLCAMGVLMDAMGLKVKINSTIYFDMKTNAKLIAEYYGIENIHFLAEDNDAKSLSTYKLLKELFNGAA